MAILDGKKLNQELLDELKKQVLKLKEKPKLVVIEVGNNQDSTIYINQKIKMANHVGYEFEHIKLKEDIRTEELSAIIDTLNNNSKVTGILIQMPLPSHLNSSVIKNKINPLKDVDGLTDENIKKLINKEDTLITCTAQGIITLLTKNNITIKEKNVVIIEYNDFIEKPLINAFINNGAIVTRCNTNTKKLKQITKSADILIVGVNKPKFITKDMVKEEATIIDVGIGRINGIICGDVDFENVSKKVSYITPVPGGVGPMTVAELGRNILKAYQSQSNK